MNHPVCDSCYADYRDYVKTHNKKYSKDQLEAEDLGSAPPFEDTMTGEISASPAVTETTFADLHPHPDQWLKIPPSVLQHAEDEPPVNIDNELFDLLAKSYAYIGGHVDFKKPSDIPANHTIWYAVDTNYDQKPDVVRFGKQSLFGTKWTGGASTGEPAAKQIYVTAVINSLRTPGNYGEVSDAIAHILIKRHNIKCVDKQDDVERVIGKKVKWVGENPNGKYPGYSGWYERELGGEIHLKILLGEPFGIHSESVKIYKQFIEANIDTNTEHDTVPNFEVLETDRVKRKIVPTFGQVDPIFTEDEEEEDVLPHPLVPFAGVTDHLFSETDGDEIVPSEIAVSDIQYEAMLRGWKRLR